MTKIVKEYIEAKIREGAQPKLDALRKKLADLQGVTPDAEDANKAVYNSQEYKALEAFIRKWAKDHHATVRGAAYRSNKMLTTSFLLVFDQVNDAKNAVTDFNFKITNAVRDALVAMELSKSKEDVDQLIAKAVADLVR